MSSHLQPHLYIVQSNFHALPKHIAHLQLLCNQDDAIVLMGESIAVLNQQQALLPCAVYVLESEVSLIMPNTIQPFLMINYAQLSDLIINANRVMTLK